MSAREEQGQGKENVLEAIAMRFKARTPRPKLATGMSSVRVRIQWFYLGSMFFTENTFVSECKDEGKSKTCKKLKSKNKCEKKKAVEECKKTADTALILVGIQTYVLNVFLNQPYFSEYECKDEVSNCKKKTKKGKKCNQDKFIKGCLSYCGLCPGMA